MTALALVEPVPDCFCFDTDTPLVRAEAEALWRVGFRGAIRPISFGAPGRGDLDGPELAMLLSVGFGVLVYQHVPYPGWIPTAALGIAHGKAGARILGAIGYLAGATVFDDLEGVAAHVLARDVAHYANAKLEVLADAKYPQGEYIGDQVPMTSAELYDLLQAQVYWRSLSVVPDVLRRGYAWRQLTTIEVEGCPPVDLTWATHDRLGGRPSWMRLAA